MTRINFIIRDECDGMISTRIMLHIFDGNLEISSHVRSNLCYLIHLRHLIRSRAVRFRIFYSRKDMFSFMQAQHFLSYHLSTMTKILKLFFFYLVTTGSSAVWTGNLLANIISKRLSEGVIQVNITFNFVCVFVSLNGLFLI